MSKPVFQLILDPDRDNLGHASIDESYQKQLENMTYTVTVIGEARGWGGNPRWDLVIEAGMKALVSEKK